MSAAAQVIETLLVQGCLSAGGGAVGRVTGKNLRSGAVYCRFGDVATVAAVFAECLGLQLSLGFHERGRHMISAICQSLALEGEHD